MDKIFGGLGTQFIEFNTYRWREHCGPNYDNDIGYRSEAEYLEWKEKDPLKGIDKNISKDQLDIETKKLKMRLMMHLVMLKILISQTMKILKRLFI